MPPKYAPGKVEANSHQLSNVSGVRTAAVVVAASDSPHQAMADYVCEGVDDHVMLNVALQEGDTYLLPGLYNLNGCALVPPNRKLSGTLESHIKYIPQQNGSVLALQDGAWVDGITIEGSPFAGSTGQYCVFGWARSKIMNCNIFNSAYDGIILVGKGGIVSGCSVHDCADDGINPSRAGTQSAQSNVIIGNVVYNMGSDGIHVAVNTPDFVGANSVVGNTISNCGAGISIYCSTYTTVVANTVIDCNRGIYVLDLPCDGSVINANTIHDIAYQGIYIVSHGGNIDITANMIDMCSYGIWSQQPDVKISGNTIWDTDNGIRLTDDAIDAIVSDNKVRSSQYAIASSFSSTTIANGIIRDNFFQSDGIGVILYNSNSNRVVENVIDAPTTRTITGSPDNVWLRNTGCITESAGIGVLSAGDTSVSLPHGLSVTPSHSDIMVTAVSDMLATGKIYIGNYTATHFTIYADVAPGGAGTTYAFKAIML